MIAFNDYCIWLGRSVGIRGRRTSKNNSSGLVQWAYKSVGINLPRTAREQSAVGKRITRVEDMRAGDIVAFHHPRRGYHTGIYVGDGKFVHSPRRRTRVRINSLDDPYFRTTFMGARRVEGSDAFSAEELRMAAYAEEQAVREISHSRSKSKAGVSQKSSRDKKSSVKKNNSRNKSKSSVSRKDSSKKSSVKKSSRSKSKSSVQKKSSSKKSSGKQGRNTKK